MTKSYRQFCPVAKASEIFAERWTPLLIRELLCGSSRFNELRRGLPMMSPSLLAQRLRQLMDAGLVYGADGRDGNTEYRLTEAGMALRPVVESLGAWGKQWVQREVTEDDLDAGLLMWDIHRRLHIDRMPERRTVLRFELVDAPTRQRFYWLVIDRGRVDICLKNPGFEEDVCIRSRLLTLTRVWLGEVSWESVVRSGRIELQGAPELIRQVGRWLAFSLFAGS